MGDLNNLDAIAEQLYREGMAKSEKESERLLNEAKTKREQLLDQAHKEAQEIVSKAKKEAEKHRISVESQIQLKAKQAMEDLKKQIKQLINAKVLDKPTHELMSDKEFVQQLVLSAMENWKDGKDLNLVISEQLSTMHKDLEHKVHKLLPEVNISFGKDFETGFKIKHEEKGYVLSFTDQDFKTLFESYFSSAINRIVFQPDE